MTAPTPSDHWDAGQYLRFAGLRGRPFLDLLAQIDHPEPELVVDLGCGPGNTTEWLVDRWPGAHVLGLDNSSAMIGAATARARVERLEFRQADLRAWAESDATADVILANAVLQWVPGHLELLPALAGRLTAGGVLGFQVPGNFTAPSHRAIAELLARPYWRDRLAGLPPGPANHEPIDYLRALDQAGLRADTWETTYTYVVSLAPDEPADPDAAPPGVTRFIAGSALRPLLTRLEPGERRRLFADYAELAALAYPPTTIGGQQVQIMPYRRIFAIGRRD